MKVKPISKLLLLLTPLVLWEIIEVFVLPIDYFTFRSWEAMVIGKVNTLPGPFYPNQNIVKMEAGDQDKDKKPKKEVHWVTDEFGLRNRPNQTLNGQYDIVLIGD